MLGTARVPEGCVAKLVCSPRWEKSYLRAVFCCEQALEGTGRALNEAILIILRVQRARDGIDRSRSERFSPGGGISTRPSQGRCSPSQVLELQHGWG